MHLWEGVVCVREGVRVAASRLRHTSSCVCVVAVRVSALRYFVHYFDSCNGAPIWLFVVTAQGSYSRVCMALLLGLPMSLVIVYD